MKFFKQLTMTTTPSEQQGTVKNAVLMGRSTWESIPERFRPLPGRINCVLTRNPDYPVPEGVHCASSLEQAVQTLEALPDVGRIFVIGGGQIYQQAIDTGVCTKVYYTQVDNLPNDTKFDTFFPELSLDDWEQGLVPQQDKENGGQDVDDEGWHTDTKSTVRFRFLEYTKLACPNPEEEQYLNLCRDILERGIQRGDRTGTGTLSLFGTQMRFDLRNGRLPLLTTKRTFWRGVAEELLWFIAVSVLDSLSRGFPMYRHGHDADSCIIGLLSCRAIRMPMI
jgi:dihydrofolate reductase/thymidylate synthase